MVELTTSMLNRPLSNQISDESDDLETPLQIWRRFYSQPSVSANVFIAPNDGNDILLNKKCPNRQRNRRRVSSREVIDDSSSDDQMVSQRKLRPRNRKLSKELQTFDRKNSKITKSRTTVGSNCLNDDLSIIEERDSPSNGMETGKRSTKSTSQKLKKDRKVTRRSRRNKKRKPLEFLNDDEKDISFNDPTSSNIFPKSPLSFQSNNEKLNDSQKTVILGTPDIQSSFDVSAEEDITKPILSASTDFLKTDTDVKFTSSPVITQVDESDCEEALNKSIPNDQSLLEATPLDELFFKSHKLKKPPPGRYQKIKKVDMLVDSNAQANVCNSLLEDDSLWVSK